MEAKYCRAMQRTQGKMLREYFSGVPVENLYRLENEWTEDHLFQYWTKKMRKGEGAWWVRNGKPKGKQKVNEGRKSNDGEKE